MERRRFLRSAVAAALGSVPLVRSGPVAGSSGHSMAPAFPNRGSDLHRHAMPGPYGHSIAPRLPDRWGVQLYTLRDLMAEDMPGTLAAVADLGYGEVEFAGYFGRSPAEVRRLLDDLGLEAPSTHVALEVVDTDLPELAGTDVSELLDAAEIMGHRQLVIPWLAPDDRTPDGYRHLADVLNRTGEAARARGMRVGYHNHDFELASVPELLPTGAAPDLPGVPGDPSRPLDYLLHHTEAELVSFQLDLFWTVHAGADPLAYFGAWPGRFISVHAKDRTADGEMVSVGEGTLDFATLLPAAEAAGVRHVFVEHDNPADPLASVTASIRHLESLRA